MTTFIAFNVYLLIWALAGQAFIRAYCQSWPRWMWLMGVVVAFILPQVSWNLPLQMVTVLPEIPLQQSVQHTLPQNSNVLLWVFILGAMSTVVCYVCQWRGVWKVRTQAKEIGGNLYEMGTLGHNKQGPFSFFHWIFLPQGISEEMRKCMILHEKVHRQRGHSWDLLLLQILHVFTWFNPAVILLRQGLQLAHEQEADELVAQREGKINYTNALLSSAFGLSHIQAIVHPFTHQKHIKMRIHILHQSKKKPVLLALVVLLGTLFTLQACTSGALPEERELTEPDVMATYPGGMDALIGFMTEHLEYPPSAKENGVEGKIMVSFFIEEDGSVANVEIVKSLDPECDRAALDIVNNMPNWEPAIANGIPVVSKMVLPVVFKLE